MQDITLDEDERDCLQELMNVAYGSATAAISKIISEYATLNIPKIVIMPASELSGYLKDTLKMKGSQFAAVQVLDGNLSGESLFVIDTQSAINLSYKFDLEDEDMDDDDIGDVVLEVTNILSSSILGRLSKDLNGSVSFLPPSVKKISSTDSLSDNYSDKYDKIFSISTELAFKEQKIRGELLLLTKDESIIWIKESLNKILDEF